MDVLVTGACGYIGSALVPMLQDDEAVDGVTILDSLSSGSPRALLGTLDEAHSDEGSSSERGGIDFRRGDVREYGDVENAMREVDPVNWGRRCPACGYSESRPTGRSAGGC